MSYRPSDSAVGDTNAFAVKGNLTLVNSNPPVKLVLDMNPASELFYHRNYTVNQNSIMQPSEAGSFEIAGVNLMYE